MSMFLKSLIGLAVALPVAAFVVGSLVVGSEDAPPRERIVIEDDSSPVGDDRETKDLGREQEPARKPSADADGDDAEDGPEGDDAGDAGGPAATDDAPFGPAATHNGPGPDHTDDRARAPGGGGGVDGRDERDDDSHAGETQVTTQEAATTDNGHTSLVARPTRSGVSVRTRIILAVALLVALALTGSGAIVYLIEHERNREQAMDEVDQEVEEFRTLQENGIDPETGEPFVGVVPLLETFLDRNVASPSEAFLAWYDGEALPGQDPGDDAYLGDPEFDRIVEDLTPSNGSRLWESPTDGEVLIAVQSVQFENDDRVGALVVVQELSERDALLVETMRTYAIVAFLSLLMVLAIALWQSGRLLSPLRTLRTTADRIGATDLSQRLPVTGNDDITALTLTVNGMLDRLESAFVSQRQFLDDAGQDCGPP